MKKEDKVMKEVIEIKYMCDLCHEEIDDDIEDVDISFTNYGKYPESESVYYECEICSKCFRDEVYPKLQEIGLTLSDGYEEL